MSTDFYFFWPNQNVMLRFDMACIKKPPALFLSRRFFNENVSDMDTVSQFRIIRF